MSVLGSGVCVHVCGARVWGIVVTAKTLQRLVSSLCHLSDDCVTTTAYEGSLTVLKHPCCVATHTRLEPNVRARIGRLFCVCASLGDRGNSQTIAASGEQLVSSIG